MLLLKPSVEGGGAKEGAVCTVGTEACRTQLVCSNIKLSVVVVGREEGDGGGSGQAISSCFHPYGAHACDACA